ncbi:unnamed protein product, partial [Prunus brigantina]
ELGADAHTLGTFTNPNTFITVGVRYRGCALKSFLARNGSATHNHDDGKDYK